MRRIQIQSIRYFGSFIKYATSVPSWNCSSQSEIFATRDLDVKLTVGWGDGSVSWTLLLPRLLTLSWIPGTHMIEGERMTLIRCPLTSTCALWHARTTLPTTDKQTSKQINACMEQKPKGFLVSNTNKTISKVSYPYESPQQEYLLHIKRFPGLPTTPWVI